MFTDMVGYTALGQRNESLSLALVEEQRKLIRPILARHNGKEVKTIGDAFLVEFPNALDAVRGAYDIQRAVREFNFSISEERRIRLRVGIHLGDVVESHGDISGDAVNVASRIEPLAEDGGVCLTRQVYDHIQNKFELSLANLGPKSLKNVGTPIEVYKMVMPWGDEKAISPRPLDKRRIAIVPFANISPDPKDEYFADGLTEELISTTSSITGLTLIARTSVMQYKGLKKGIDEIGRELDVGTVLEGSVRKAGNRLRITVQLIDVQTQGHLWAQSYDRGFDDIFSVQSDIAKQVADALEVQMLPSEVRRVEKKPTENTEAYALYIRAMQLSHEGTEPSLTEALALFNRAISADSGFARAYAGLSQVWVQMAGAGYEDFGDATRKAEAAAAEALELDANSAEAHAAMSHVHSMLDRYDAMVAEAKKAAEINPSLADAYVSLGINHATWVRMEQALAALRKAFELDPLSVHTGAFLALVCRVAAKEAEGLKVLERMRELNPRTPRVYVGLAEHYLLKRDFNKAQEMLDEGFALNPNEPLLRMDQGILYALSGRSDEAKGSLVELERDGGESVPLYARLFIQAALGNLDEAFKALAQMTEVHNWPFLIKSLPIFEELRKDPRFRGFCVKVGLPV
jgi:adenylate cyclase